MYYRLLLVSSLLAGACPILAQAQETSGGLTVGYGYTDVSGSSEDASSLSLDGRVGFDAGNGLRFGADFNGVRLDPEGTSGNETASVLGFYGGYRFTNGTTLGAYAERGSLDVSGSPDVSATSYGLMLGFEAEGAMIGGFYGATDTSPDLPAGVDLRDYGATFRYTSGAGHTIGASLVRTNLSVDGAGDADLDFAGLAGSIAVAPSWTLFGGVSNGSIDLVDVDVTSIGLGVSYDLAAVSSMNASVSLELARTELDAGLADEDATTVRLGLSIPLGGRGFTVPMNSVADSILNPRHSAISSTILSAF